MAIKSEIPAVMSDEKLSSSAGIYNVGENDEAVRAVPTKFRGTEADRMDMEMLGKKQVLRRNFRFATMLGFSSTAVASWEVLLPLSAFVFIDGGSALLFWGFLVVMIGQTLVYASIAEMSSMSPTAGGQYHWVSELAPPNAQKFLSYLTGWLTAVGWQVFLAGSCFICATEIQGLLVLNFENYVWHQWHGTLLTIAVISFSVIFNILLAVYLPIVEGGLLILHVLGWFAIVIPLWITAPRGSARDVLLTFSNNGGWSSKGLSAMIGLASPMACIIGYDCSVHLSEELHDASRAMPRSIMWSCAINFTMTFILGVTLIFCVGDIDSVLATPTFQPFIQIFYNATQSYAGTNNMTAIVIILMAGCCIGESAASSRQIWSFSRDGGFPGSSFLSQINTRWGNIPLRAVVLCTIITALLACINLGSSVALNAISSLGGVSILTSYYISISCVVYRRLKGIPLPPRRWSLGRYGLAINIGALAFLTPIWFFSWWPLATPVTPTNMNWASAMFGGVMIVAMSFYFFSARHGRYVGPVVNVKRE